MYLKYSVTNYKKELCRMKHGIIAHHLRRQILRISLILYYPPHHYQSAKSDYTLLYVLG